MARINAITAYTVELNAEEMALVRRALRLVDPYGSDKDWDPARDLLAELDDVEGGSDR